MSEPAFGKWLLIETAPKDGTAILAYEGDAFDDGSPHHWIDVVRFEWPDRGLDGWYSIGDQKGPPSCNPTHWMPLPAPPQSDQGSVP